MPPTRPVAKTTPQKSNDFGVPMGHQHGQQQQHSISEEEQQMEDFMDLFTSTVQSLAADAACIREITSLAELTGVMPSSPSFAFQRRFSQDHDDEENYVDKQQELKQKYRQELVKLDKLIANVEQKVIALREIINEENQALVKFETVLKDEAYEQDALIQEMLSLVMMMGSDTEEDSDDNGRHGHTRVLQPRQQSLGNRSLWKSSIDSTKSSESLSKRRLRNSNFERGNNQDDDDSDKEDNHGHQGSDTGSDNHPHHRPSEIFFEPVTESEILEQKRNVPFGLRMTRHDLNDAMEEIQQVVERKLALEERSSHQFQESRRTPSNSLQRRADYLRQRHQGSHGGDAIETDAHNGYWWVSEQELRENCAFFRHGESSARGILSLLCSLRRLKQVPGKNMEITYLWL
jgi:hypothetical protein